MVTMQFDVAWVGFRTTISWQTGKQTSERSKAGKLATRDWNVSRPFESCPPPHFSSTPSPCGSVPIVAAATSDFLSPPSLRSFSVHLMLYSYFVGSQRARQRRVVRKRKTVKERRKELLVMGLTYRQCSFSQFSNYLALRNLHDMLAVRIYAWLFYFKVY